MFGLQFTDLKIPCQTFQCYGRAAFSLGKPDSPNGTAQYVCDQCAQELRDSIIAEHEASKPVIEAELPFEDGPEEAVSEGKLEDLKVDALKAIAEGKGITGISKKNKAELIELIEGAE